MARTGSISGGTISPFGGGGVDFGVFDIANTKSVSAQETAGNAWALARAQYDAGLITDEEYMAAQAAYYAALDPASSGYATGQYQIAQTQYSIQRDQLTQQVQMGDLPPGALVDFDRNALGQVSQGSAEWRQRYDRLMASEGQVFQLEEAKVQRDYQRGYLTSQQLQDWYKGQAETYVENFAVNSDISDKIEQLQGRIDGEADQKLIKGFNEGQVTIGQLLAYTQRVQQADPNSQRARDLQDAATQAKAQVVETSLTYRYGLTREYQQLAAFVASNSSTTTQYSTSHQTRTYLDANGQWKTVTTAITKAVKPSASEVRAAQKRAIEVAAAKERMAAITKEVGSLPGGWVSADDVIAQLRNQQAQTKVGSPAWFALQKNIDGYMGDKAQMELIAEQGIKITFPKVGSELTKDVSVSPLEHPLKAGATPSIAPAALPGAAGGGGSSSPAAGGASGGGRPGPVGATGVGSSVAGSGPFNVVEGSWVWQQTKGAVVAGPYNAAAVKTSKAGWPTGMSPSAFDDLYDHAVAAVKDGKATFTYGGVSYAIPTDPKARLDFLAAVDDKNVALRAEQWRATASKPGVSQSAVDSKARAYYNAVAKSETNKLYILNSPTPGALRQSGSVIRIVEYPVNPANSLGFAQQVYDAAESYVKDQYDQAARYMKMGDYTSAAQCLGLANDRIASATATITRWTGKATAFVDATIEDGAKKGVAVTVPPEISSALAKLSDPGALWTPVVKPGEKIATELFGTFDARTGQQTSQGILRVVDGQPIMVRTPDGRGWEAALGEGVVRVVSPDGTISTTRSAVVGKNPDGSLRPGGPDTVTVKVKTLNGYVDALAKYTVGPSMFVANVGGAPVQLTSKIVTVNGETWFENPLQPGQWLPNKPGGMVNVAVGPNVRAVTIQTGAGMEGVQAGTQALAFDINGTGYMLTPDATGTYNLWRQSIDGTPQLLGPAGTAGGKVAQDIAGVLASGGIHIDGGSLTADQRGYLTVASGQPVGAWFGTSPQAVNSFLHPPATPSIPFDTRSESLQQARAYTAATAPAAAIYEAPRSEGTAIRTQPLTPSAYQGGVGIGTGLMGPVGPSYSAGPTYTPTTYYGASSYSQPTKTPVVNPYTGAVTGYKPVAPAYGEGSAVTTKPLTPPKPTPNVNPNTGFVLPPVTAPPKPAPRPNTGGAAARGR